MLLIVPLTASSSVDRELESSSHHGRHNAPTIHTGVRPGQMVVGLNRIHSGQMARRDAVPSWSRPVTLIHNSDTHMVPDMRITSEEVYSTVSGEVESLEWLAPRWPFSGVVSYGSVPEPREFGVLQYWNADTGGYSEVRLIHSSWPIGGCPGLPVANEDAVQFNLDNWPRVIYSVPWGDEAYPIVVGSQDTAGRPESISFGEAGTISIVSDGVFSVVRVSVGTLQKYYSVGAYGLSLTDHDPEKPQESDGVVDFPTPIVLLDGTDGYHWGVRVVSSETACPDENGFIFAIETGELVACGWSRGGALLISQPEVLAQVDTIAFPETVTDWDNDQCNQAPLDISGLKIPNS
ncbi:MAG: hypothetical protein OXI96_06195 [Acidimicrobiaceae bacterium]|nr:hypothetical protein [Acidimicrobiaceae bacterium]